MNFTATLTQGDKTVVDHVQGDLKEGAATGGSRSLAGHFDFPAKSSVGFSDYELRLEDGRTTSIRILQILTSSAAPSSRAHFQANGDFKRIG